MRVHTVIGASDAGIYVGQSKNIIVRRNLAEYNVAGIEIENSTNADVYENEVRYNTGGILVFDLPDLFVPAGKNTKIYKNNVYSNNTENFASAAGTVAFVPAGTGVLLLASKNTEIFENKIKDHYLASITLASYYVTGLKTKDKRFDHLVKGAYIHDNDMSENSTNPFKSGSFLGYLLMGLSLPEKVPHIVFDGIGEDANGKPVRFNHKGRDQICIGKNKTDSDISKIFAQFDFTSDKWWKPFPGEFADFSKDSFDCKHENLVKISEDYNISKQIKLANLEFKKPEKVNYCEGFDASEV